MKVKELKKQLEEILLENPEATIGITVLSPVLTIADIDCICEQDENSEGPDYSIQPL